MARHNPNLEPAQIESAIANLTRIGIARTVLKEALPDLDMLHSRAASKVAKALDLANEAEDFLRNLLDPVEGE